MEAVGHDDAALAEEAVAGDEARAELERLLCDAQFQSTERNKNFLRFVAQEVFAGRGGTVKAYAIAVDVFGRPSSFDPATDPIVRIEATRLRASLSRYYEVHAGKNPVRIDLPKGRYVPVLTRTPVRDAVAPAPAPQAPAGRAQARSASARLWPSAKALWTALALGGLAGLCLGAVLAVIGLETGRGPVVSEKPSLTLDMRLAGESDAEALVLRDMLMVALSQFQTVRVLTDEMPTRAILADMRPAAPSARASAYHVVLKYQAGLLDSAVWWQVIDPASGEAVRSGVERVPAGARDTAAVRQALVTGLATRLGATRGVINAVETARELTDPTLGNGCVLRAALALEDPLPDGLPEVRACLEATLALRPNDADSHAALAAVLLRLDKPEAPTALSAQALELANRSVMLAPQSDRGGVAQMMAQFRNGQIEAAIAAGRRAMALNPNNGAIPAKLGALLFTIGRWDEAWRWSSGPARSRPRPTARPR